MSVYARVYSRYMWYIPTLYKIGVKRGPMNNNRPDLATNQVHPPTFSLTQATSSPFMANPQNGSRMLTSAFRQYHKEASRSSFPDSVPLVSSDWGLTPWELPGLHSLQGSFRSCPGNPILFRSTPLPHLRLASFPWPFHLNMMVCH